jgi:dTDP-4-dehydrorhamnose reductase
VLVIGAAGMLGHDLMDILPHRWEVRGADIDEVDITDASTTKGYVASLGPRTVINAAARTDVDGCELDPARAFAVNAGGARNVAEACRAAGARLVHLSTDYVFDGLKGEPYREDDTPNPQGVYAKSKLAGEEAVQGGARDHLIVRTSWLFGAHGKNFVDTILRAAAKPVLQVVGDQRGSPTFTRDLAEAIARLLEVEHRGIIHVTNSGICSWCEYARAILDMAGMGGVRIEEITTAQLGRPAPRPPFSALDCSLYSRLTGARMRHWREAVREYIGSRAGAA